MRFKQAVKDFCLNMGPLLGIIGIMIIIDQCGKHEQRTLAIIRATPEFCELTMVKILESNDELLRAATRYKLAARQGNEGVVEAVTNRLNLSNDLEATTYVACADLVSANRDAWWHLSIVDKSLYGKFTIMWMQKDPRTRRLIVRAMRRAARATVPYLPLVCEAPAAAEALVSVQYCDGITPENECINERDPSTYTVGDTVYILTKKHVKGPARVELGSRVIDPDGNVVADSLTSFDVREGISILPNWVSTELTRPGIYEVNIFGPEPLSAEGVVKIILANDPILKLVTFPE